MRHGALLHHVNRERFANAITRRRQGMDRTTAGVSIEQIDAWDLWSLHEPPESRRDAINGLLQPAQAE